MFDFRFDRTISLYVFRPLLRGLNGRRGARIPILMYHSVREGTEGCHPYYETNTSPQVFTQHMRFLHENGYRTISLNDTAEFLASPQGSPGLRSEIPGRSVVITFDDGYLDFYSRAYPVLCEHGFTATVFVVTGLLKTQRAHFNGKECLSVSEVRELHSKGITVGSHTVTHRELRGLTLDEMDNELAGSKKALEDAIGVPIKSFSYPYAFPEADGRFVSCLEKTLNDCGYENGVSTILGTAKRGDTRFFLPRLPMNSYDDLRFFRAKLEGGYDWLHFPQSIYKKLTS